MSNSSIRPIDRTLSGATTPVRREPGSNDNEGVIHISQSSLAGASASVVCFHIQDTRFFGGNGILLLGRDVLGAPSPIWLKFINLIIAFSLFSGYEVDSVHEKLGPCHSPTCPGLLRKRIWIILLYFCRSNKKKFMGSVFWESPYSWCYSPTPSDWVGTKVARQWRCTQNSAEIENWSLTTGYSFESYSGTFFLWEGGLIPGHILCLIDLGKEWRKMWYWLRNVFILFLASLRKKKRS